MISTPNPCASVRIATGSLPAAGRLPALRELFDRSIGMDISAAQEQLVDLHVHVAPGLRRALMLHPFTARAERPAARLADGDDTVCMMIKTGGNIALKQGRRESTPLVGGGVLLAYRQTSQLQFEKATYISLRVPFQALAVLADVEEAAARSIAPESAALHLLRLYVGGLPARLDDPVLGKLVATHVYDLMALALGASREGRELAKGRGVRAARFATIQDDLGCDPDLPIEVVARNQGVTTRYVQMLFEENGTTFGEFVTARKLEAARSMLCSPRYAAWSIAGIAYEAGFRDLSNFNRRFRRRYGVAPSEMRATEMQAIHKQQLG